ncbi:T9SS type A sorting domain-containing protein [Labilibacter sediminis]|nr:T9SS type A sorting domain-containing protein [Labilibacter sediminis]
MKRNLLLTLVLGLGITLNAQFTNNDFETWEAPAGTSSYSVPAPASTYGASNLLANAFVAYGLSFQGNVIQTSDASEGASAAHLESLNQSAYGQPVGILGVLHTGTATIGVSYDLMVEYTDRPTSLTVAYKYAPAAGDKCVMYAVLKNGDEVVATAELADEVRGNAVATYTDVELVFSYVSESTPTHIGVYFSASDFSWDQYMTFNPQTTVVGEGSLLKIDNLRINSTPTTITEVNEVDVKIFPNPVSDVLYIQAELTADISLVQVYTLTGQLVKTINSNLGSISVSDLPVGKYIAVLKDGDTIIGSEAFVKK